MTWSTSWAERAEQEAKRRQLRYGLSPPVPVSSLIERSHEQPIGLWGALRLMIYAVFGSPGQRLRLWWRLLTDRDTPVRLRQVERLAAEIRGDLSPEARVLVGSFERGLYASDLASVPPAIKTVMFRSMPMLVIQPRDEKDLVAICRFARPRELALYPRGVASSAFGGAVPTSNGIVVDLSALLEVIEIDAEARTATVQPGLRWGDLAQRLAEQGLAPLTNPTSRFSTIGGWASTGGMGVDSFAHGHFREAILEARVILPSGEVQRLERGERGDELLDEMIGCEGQLGFFSELTLRVREKPTRSSPRLVTFDSPDKALAFVEELIEGEHRPSHVVFFDKAKMVEENLYALDRFGDGVALVDERDSVLLHFDDAEAEEHFLDTLGKDHGLEAKAHQTAARYLWADRFFPLKGQRLGPNLLASEVVLPRASLPGYVKAARRLASRFGSHLGVEVTFGRDGDEVVGVTIASYACDRTRKLDYMVRLVLTQLLTHLGMRSGGKPYGVGIWNTPFLPRKLSAETRARLRARKRELDPEGMLNPRKFFGLKTRFLGLPGLLFVPVIQDLGLWAMLLISPLLGLMARAMARPSPTSWAVPTPGEEKGRRLLAETSLRCTKCGSCVSTCPAYLITHDERVTGRAKLQLFEALEQRPDELVADEAHRPAQCLRCGLCEEVCQTRLPLRDCYDALEAQVEARFGPATELAEAFSQRLDQNRGWIATAFGLELPPWKPGEGALRVSGSHDKEDAA